MCREINKTYRSVIVLILYSLLCLNHYTHTILNSYSHNLASSPSVEDDVDFADSGGGIDTDVYMDVECACKSIEGVNALDAFQRLEDTTGAVEGNDEMDMGELVGAAIASPLDTAAIDAAVEACNNINVGGDGVALVSDKKVVGGINVLDDATIVRKCSKLGLSELCHVIGVASTNVSVVFNIFRACTKLYDGGIKDEQFVVARSKLSGVQVMYCKSSRTGYIGEEELHLSDEDLQMPDEEDSAEQELDIDWSKNFWEIALSDSTKSAPSADRFENLVNVEPHLVQEHMIYGKESTQVSVLLCHPFYSVMMSVVLAILTCMCFSSFYIVILRIINPSSVEKAVIRYLQQGRPRLDTTET